jgi:hypothetical protein
MQKTGDLLLLNFLNHLNIFIYSYLPLSYVIFLWAPFFSLININYQNHFLLFPIFSMINLYMILPLLYVITPDQYLLFFQYFPWSFYIWLYPHSPMSFSLININYQNRSPLFTQWLLLKKKPLPFSQLFFIIHLSTNAKCYVLSWITIINHQYIITQW